VNDHELKIEIVIPLTRKITDEEKTKFRSLFSARLQGYHVDPTEFKGLGGAGDLELVFPQSELDKNKTNE